MIVLKNKYHKAQANVTASFTLKRKLHPIRAEEREKDTIINRAQLFEHTLALTQG